VQTRQPDRKEKEKNNPGGRNNENKQGPHNGKKKTERFRQKMAVPSEKKNKGAEGPRGLGSNLTGCREKKLSGGPKENNG